jgi:hypothetical protein
MSDYLFDNPALPVIRSAEEILPALRRDFTRAVTFRHADYDFSNRAIRAVANFAETRAYHLDAIDPRRRYAGRIGHTGAVDTEDVQRESAEAGIVLDGDTAADFATRCKTLRTLFSTILEDYTDGAIADTTARLLFTPKGGLGRAATLHVDNTILTLHWSAALAPLGVLNGEPDENLWQALDRRYKDGAGPAELRRIGQILERADDDDMLDLRDNAIGDIVIGKGQRGRDLSQPEARREAFVHKSSAGITRSGQAAFVLTPLSS